MCIKFKIDGAQNFSRMCMCIEFVIQVLKQENAHISFPVGMVVPKTMVIHVVFSGWSVEPVRRIFRAFRIGGESDFVGG